MSTIQTRRETKRQLVERLIKEQPKASNMEIATQAMCHKAYVATLRKHPNRPRHADQTAGFRKTRDAVSAFFCDHPEMSGGKVAAKFGVSTSTVLAACRDAGFFTIDEFREHHRERLLREQSPTIDLDALMPPSTPLGALLRTRWQRSAVKRALDSVQPIIEEQEAAA